MQYQQESGVQAHKSIDEVWRGYKTSSSLDRGLPKLKMVTAKLVEEKYIQLEKELASVSRDILRQFPLDNCLSDLESDRRREILLNFRRTRSQRHVFEKMVSQYGDRTVRLYLKLVLCGFIRSSMGRLSPESIPGEIADLYHQWFEAILGEFSTRPNSRYDYRSVSLGVDMRICSLTDIPVGGAWIAETRRMTLRPILKGGIRQFFGYPAFAIFKCGGFTPYYMFHTARRYLRYFNEKEMNLAYLRIAEMMKLNRNIKGLHNLSWFLDPQLEHPILTSQWRVFMQSVLTLNIGLSLRSVPLDQAFDLGLGLLRKCRPSLDQPGQSRILCVVNCAAFCAAM